MRSRLAGTDDFDEHVAVVRTGLLDEAVSGVPGVEEVGSGGVPDRDTHVGEFVRVEVVHLLGDVEDIAATAWV